MRAKRNVLPGAAFAALIAAIIVYCVMLNVEKNALADYEKGSILTTKCQVPEGTVFTEENVSEYVQSVEINVSLIPEQAVVQKEELYHRIAAVDLDSGCFLTESLVTDISEIEMQMQEPVVAGFKADDLFQVVSGILRSGDRIHIVQEVFDSSGSNIAAGNKTQAAYRVNILMEKDDVEQFYSELARGSLRVVKAINNGG